jgi:hypothetical protein
MGDWCCRRKDGAAPGASAAAAAVLARVPTNHSFFLPRPSWTGAGRGGRVLSGLRGNAFRRNDCVLDVEAALQPTRLADEQRSGACFGSVVARGNVPRL